MKKLPAPQDVPLKPFSVRARATDLERAKALGIDVQATFRKALGAELAKATGACPTCGVKTETVGKWTRKLRS